MDSATLIRRLAWRLLQSLAVLLAMSVAIHALMGLMPGDPIDLMIAGDPHLTAADAARLKALYGLDQSWGERWVRWFAQVARGHLGYSRLYARPVAAVMLPALGNTLILMGASLALSLSLALPLGMAAAARPGSALDRALNLFAFSTLSLPTFWLGLMLIAVFAVRLGWLPASGTGAGDGFQGQALILPATTLGLAGCGQYLRHMREAMIGQARREYSRTARAKGCSPLRVMLAHQLRNAALPVVTLVALEAGGLFSGALIAETVFAWPGMGRLIVDAVLGNDFNLALTALLFATAMTLAGSMLADAAYLWLDPRMRRS